MTFQVGSMGYNPYGGYGQYQPTYPPQMPTYSQPQSTVPSFGMGQMMQMFMMLMMQLLQNKQTPTSIDGSTGSANENVVGRYGANAAINLLDSGLSTDQVNVKYTDDTSNLDNVFAYTKMLNAAQDINGDGALTADEMLATGMSNTHAGNILTAFDRNHDGAIDLAESVAATLVKDADHDGTISTEEKQNFSKELDEHPDQLGESVDKALTDNKLEDAAKKFGQDTILGLGIGAFNKIDTNQDGYITADENLAFDKKNGKFWTTKDDAKEQISRFDVDGDGKNSLLESLGALTVMDSNKDWDLSRSEYRTGNATLTGNPDYVQTMVKNAIEERGLADLLKTWQDAHQSA